MKRLVAPPRAPHFGLLHSTLTGAAVLGLLFLLLWASQALADAAGSKGVLGALIQQSLASPGRGGRAFAVVAIVGAAGGLLIALSYNLVAIMLRRTRP